MNEKKQNTTAGSGGQADGVKAPTRRRWLKRLVLSGAVVLIVLVALVLLLPTLLSTGAGKGVVFGTVNDGIVGEVEADRLSIGWFGGQSVSGLVVRAEDGTEVARVGRVDLPGATLFGLLRGGLAIGEARIESVTADIIGYDDGTTNLQRALASRGGAAKTTKPGEGTTSGPGGEVLWPKGLSFDLVVRDVDVAYRAHGVAEPVRLNIKEADLAGADPTRLLFKLNADVSRGDQTGAVLAEAQLDDLFDGAGVYQLDAASAQVSTLITDLPTDLLDTLLEQGGKLSALLGPVINGDIKSEMNTAGGTATLSLVSEHMDVDGGVAFSDQGVVGAGTSHVRLTVTPAAWAAFSPEGGTRTSTLAEPVGIAVELSEFDLPLTDAGLGLADARVDLKMTVGDTLLQIDKVGKVELKGTSGMIHTDRLGSSLAAAFKTTSAINDRPGGVSVDIELSHLVDEKHLLNLAAVSAKVNGKLTNAPVAAVLDELIPDTTQGLATRTLGPTIDADVSLTTQPNAQGDGVTGSFNVDLLTTGGEVGLLSALIGTFATTAQTAELDLADGSYAKFDLTPELIEAYQAAFAPPQADAVAAKPARAVGGRLVKPAEDNLAAGRVTLAGSTSVRLSFSEVYSRFVKNDDGVFAIDRDSARVTARLRSPEVKLNQQGQLAATLSKLLMDIQSEGLTGDTRLVMNAKVDYPATNADDAPRSGLVESATNVSGLIGNNGEIDATKASYQTVTRVQQAPIDLIDAMFEMNGELVAAVGPRALLDVVGSYSPANSVVVSADAAGAKSQGIGGFDFLLKSRTASADMKLLVEEGKWTLKADAPLSFQVTPRLSQSVLKKVNPFLGGAISAKLPIGVTVKQEGFSVPLHEATIRDVNANINLELGELDLRGEGVLKKLLEQLGVGDRSLLNVGFSPVAINLVGGKLSYKDLAMSVGDVVLGFSGDVDLNNQKLDLKMTIPGSSLSNIKWLKGAVDPNQVIVVPLGGTFDQPTLDFKLLSGEIAKAALKGQLEGVAGDAIGDKLGDKIGGGAGAAVGGLLNDWISGKDSGSAPASTSQLPTPQGGDASPTPALPGAVESEPVAEPELTAEEREARKERRRIRRERLEREQAEREKQP